MHRGLALADDGEIDERSARARLVGLPELLQLAGDGGDFDGRAEGGGGCAGQCVSGHDVEKWRAHSENLTDAFDLLSPSP